MAMPSEEIRAFNQHARTALKASFNADYDPVAFREARAAPALLEADSTVVAVGHGRLEYRPSKGRKRIVVYVAGGGFCFDASDSHRALVDEISAAVDADACLIRYRLAPEHPFPAAFDDVAAAMAWCCRRLWPGSPPASRRPDAWCSCQPSPTWP